MEQYIPKSALVAEIKRISCENPMDNSWYVNTEELLDFLDTLEVKEVDLKEYYNEFLQKEWFESSHVRTVSEMMAFTAKHFFELGIKVAQKGE